MLKWEKSGYMKDAVARKSGYCDSIFRPFAGLLLVVIWCARVNGEWNINLEPKQTVDASSIGCKFRGKDSDGQYGQFKLVESEREFLLVGAKNFIYNLSVDDLGVQAMLEWAPTQRDVDVCRMKGKSEDECENYVRVLAKQKDGRLLVCGTNAYKPMCRQYALSEDDQQYQMQREFSGFAISPYDPRHNSTAFYVDESDELYAGTVSDFTGSDPLIYRKPLSDTRNELRTQRNNINCLNDPHFVSVLTDEEAIYFFFRETALEYANCHGTGREKAAYARVGRVCRSDQGGTRAYSDTWTTFTKARLNCSLPGTTPFYFDELQSTAIVSESAYGKRIIYAVFTTPHNGLRASAVCAFRLDDVKRVLNQSPFKVQSSPTSAWRPLGSDEAPSPRPGTCSGNSRSLSDDVLKFIQKNPLVDEAVPSFLHQPLIVHSDLRSQFTCIAVHPNVESINPKENYDVVFVGTDHGHVLKFVNFKETGRTVLMETIGVFLDGRRVLNLMIHLSEPKSKEVQNGRLVVVSKDELKTLPMHYCQNKTTCGGCVRLQDPYCAWNVESGQCVGRVNGYWSDGEYKQALTEGAMANCEGDEPQSKVMFTLNDVDAQPVLNQKQAFASEGSMAVAITVTLSIASTIGFLIGYRYSRWRMKSATDYGSSSASSSSGTCYVGAKLADSRSAGRPSPMSDLIKDPDEVTKLVLSPMSNDKQEIFHLGSVKDEKERFLNPLDNVPCPPSNEYKVKRMYL